MKIQSPFAQLPAEVREEMIQSYIDEEKEDLIVMYLGSLSPDQIFEVINHLKGTHKQFGGHPHIEALKIE